MAGTTKRHNDERFLPCVLERLIDLNPGVKHDTADRTISLEELRLSILGNIRLLLNSRFRPEFSDLGEDPELKRSVLGFGLSDFCGLTHSQACLERVRSEMLEQIRAFEPRLDPESVAVVLDDKHSGPTSWSLFISGTIRAKSLSGELLCISEVDLESGAASLELADWLPESKASS